MKLINTRIIWIYRELYYGFIRGYIGIMNDEEIKKISRVILKEFFHNEISFEEYNALQQVDMIQRIQRVIPKDKENQVIIKMGNVEEKAIEFEAYKDSQLRCPIRSEDRDNPEFFNYIEKPYGLNKLEKDYVSSVISSFNKNNLN